MSASPKKRSGINKLAAIETTMKRIIFLLIIAFFTSCGQSNPDKESKQDVLANVDTPEVANRDEESRMSEQIDTEPLEGDNYQNSTLNYELKNATLFQLTDSIIADFNGDGQQDQAVFKKDSGTSGIIIRHGQTNEEVKIGFGQQFGHLTEFNWVDFWGLVEDSVTYEIIIEDAEIIGDTTAKLENPSIVVRKEEVGGGIVTFRNGKYEWVHQSD